LLHLLLKISDSVTRLEALLLIASPNEGDSTSPRITAAKMPGHLNIGDVENVEERWVSLHILVAFLSQFEPQDAR
jgi:hypothetical protein